jgi:DNA-binding NarL/FixJ family response regulator
MKIVLVDDNMLFREDLKYFLENKLGHTVITEAGNRDELFSIGNLENADIILIGFSLGIMSGLEDARKILKISPEVKIIAIAMNCENAILLKLKEAGFSGYIDKTNIFKSIDSILRSVEAGEFLFPERITYTNPGKNGKPETEYPCSEKLEV